RSSKPSVAGSSPAGGAVTPRAAPAHRAARRDPMLRFLTFGAIALLILLRLARTRFGARLLGVSLRALHIIYLVALVVAGILAAVFEQWILLAVVGILLAISVIEEIRRRSSQEPRVSRR